VRALRSFLHGGKVLFLKRFIPIFTSGFEP